MKTTSCVLAAVLCLVAYPSLATDASQRNLSNAINELFVLIGVDRQMSAGFDAMLPALDQLSSELKLTRSAKEELKGIYRSWFENDIDRMAIKRRYVQLYAAIYTEKEIHQLIDFYQSPIGQKFLKSSQVLMKEGVKIGMEEAAAKQYLLYQRLQPFIDVHKKH